MIFHFTYTFEVAVAILARVTRQSCMYVCGDFVHRMRLLSVKHTSTYYHRALRKYILVRLDVDKPIGKKDLQHSSRAPEYAVSIACYNNGNVR